MILELFVILDGIEWWVCLGGFVSDGNDVLMSCQKDWFEG